MDAAVHKYTGKTSPEKSNFAQTCNLLSQFLKEKSNLAEILNRNLQPATTLDLLPAMESSPENLKEEKSGEVAGFGSGGKQMTIVYAGKVMVFDDLLAEKAKEIMALAAGAGSFKVAAAGFAASSPVEKLKCLDLPIARRASLHRFFEKRRDRVIATAPYHINKRSEKISATLKPEERRPWLELEAQSSRQLELKL